MLRHGDDIQSDFCLALNNLNACCFSGSWTVKVLQAVTSDL